MPDDNLALVRAVFDAMRSGDRSAYLGRLDPDLTIEPSANAPEQRVLRGVDGFERWISVWPGLFEEYEVHPERFSVAGDDVVVALHETARSARSDHPIEDRFAHVWTVRHGVVVRIRVFDDERAALDAADPDGEP
ncbi:MAG: nuclear transport factor 2 family protein [Solirubrobacterales bacterium]